MSGDSIFRTSWNDASEGEASYTRPSVAALLSVVFGLGTFLVYFTPWFFFLGVIAILLSLIALWMIHRAEGTLSGTSFAYFGLCCAVVALVSVFLFWQTYQYGIRRESDQFFRLWFAAVQNGDIPQAKEYQFIYTRRSNAATAEEWWQAQYGEKNAHRAAHQFVENKLVRVLMALGSDAKVSYYKTLSFYSEPESDTISSVYAVTFPAESGETETFFVRIHGTRLYPSEPDFKHAGWRLEGTPAFYLPDESKKVSSE
jgi:hypothetical protein